MERRKLLTALASCGVVSTAGCVGTQGGVLGGGQPQAEPSERAAQRDRAMNLGEEVEYKGLIVEVNQFETAPQLEVLKNPDEESEPENAFETPPTPGAIWALIHISVEHAGDRRRMFPDPGETTLVYEDADTASRLSLDKRFSPVEKQAVFHSYTYALLRQKIHKHGAFPGIEADGWLVYEIPEKYDLEKLLLEVRWGPQNAVARWVFN